MVIEYRLYKNGIATGYLIVDHNKKIFSKHYPLYYEIENADRIDAYIGVENKRDLEELECVAINKNYKEIK